MTPLGISQNHLARDIDVPPAVTMLEQDRRYTPGKHWRPTWYHQELAFVDHEARVVLCSHKF